MENKKLGFEDFIRAVDQENRAFVEELKEYLMERGCKIDVKMAKSGYMVSYVSGKRTLLNFVFRKKGILIRIYASGITRYMEFLETLPQGMIEAVTGAAVCKRLMNPEACNSRCPMGYEFILRGEPFQKCRNGAFFFPLCEENNPFIRTFIKKELEASA